jgi:cysteine desulfurase
MSSQLIYLDHASTTQPSSSVVATIADCQRSYWGNPHSIHSLGQAAKRELKKASEVIKTLLCTDKGEIIFTAGGSDANNRIINAIAPETGQLATSTVEHKSIDQYRLKGQTIWFEPDLGYADFFIPRVLKNVSVYTKLVSIIHTNNETGRSFNICALASAIKNWREGTLFHTDLTAGIVKATDLEVELRPVDAVTLSAHKIYGPKGVGCLWVKDKALAEHIKASQYFGTPDLAGILGFAKAVEGFSPHKENEITSEQVSVFMEGLSDLDDFEILCTESTWNPSTMSVFFKDVDGQRLVMELSDRGVMCSHGSACSTGEATRVLEAFGIPREKAQCTVRFSFGRQVTVEQVKKATEIIKSTIKEIRNEED